MTVDVVVLTRGSSPIDDRVLCSLRQQEGVNLRIHQVVGTPLPDDPSRWSTIARARNKGRLLGNGAWLMFVDDDVALGRDCVASLIRDLERQPRFGALAADYLGERNTRGISPHVAMGATLFRREVIQDVQFRSTGDRCECQCCCDDLRRRFWGIDYSTNSNAVHLETASTGSSCECEHSASAGESPTPHGEILVAFDHSHLHAFKHRFLRTLRASGNSNHVHAVVYGLSPRDLRRLRSLERVTLHPNVPRFGSVARDRLSGFRHVLMDLDANTPVAYWDAGDVIFQSRLDPLWERILRSQNELIVSAEPMVTEENGVYLEWLAGIRDVEVRRNAMQIVHLKPILNGGFAAGTAGRVLSYLEAAFVLAEEIGNGIFDHGVDQTVMNLHLYGNDDADFCVEDDWSYCLAARYADEYSFRDNVYIDLRKNRPIPVVHGNGSSLRRSAIHEAVFGSS